MLAEPDPHEPFFSAPAVDNRMSAQMLSSKSALQRNIEI
jgi:hypothetical protein